MRKRKIQRMLVKSGCVAGILIALNVDIYLWRTWLMLASLTIIFDLDILFLDVGKGE